MGRIADDGVIGVLPALDDDILCQQHPVVIPKAEICRYIVRITDFLQRQHVRPEGVNVALPASASILRRASLVSRSNVSRSSNFS